MNMHNYGSQTYYKCLTPKFTQYNMSSSPLLQGSEKIDKNSTGQNQIVWFTKSDSPVFLDKRELNTKELGTQDLIDISPPLSLRTKKYWGGLLEASLIVIIFIFAFFNIL
jgi:hypothetical protein